MKPTPEEKLAKASSMIANALNQVLVSQKSYQLQPKTPSMKNHRFYKTNLNNHTVLCEINKKRNAKDWTWYFFDIFNKGDSILRQQRTVLNSSKNIQNLELVHFTTVATNSGLNHLCQGLKNLVCLRDFHFCLSPCLSVTDKGLHYLGQSLKQLKNLESVDLSFRGRFNITDQGISSLSKGLRTLVCLKNVNLYFLACYKITDDGINYLSEGLKGLKGLERISLDFSKCNEITDFGMECLGKMLKGLRSSLQKVKLEFESCEKITDIGMGYLSEGLKNLEFVREIHINLSGDRQVISDAGLERVIGSLGALDKLKEVNRNFVGCDRITKAGQKKAQKALREERFLPLEKVELRFVYEPRMTESERKKKSAKRMFILGLVLLFASIVATYFIEFIHWRLM